MKLQNKKKIEFPYNNFRMLVSESSVFESQYLEISENLLTRRLFFRKTASESRFFRKIVNWRLFFQKNKKSGLCGSSFWNLVSTYDFWRSFSPNLIFLILQFLSISLWFYNFDDFFPNIKECCEIVVKEKLIYFCFDKRSRLKIK